MQTLLSSLAALTISLTAYAATLQNRYEVNPLVQEVVRPVFPQELFRACSCESMGNASGTPAQWDKSGKPVVNRNKNGTIDYGACQINSTHQARADKLGLDFVNSYDDNLAMAKVLYDERGIGQWYGYDAKRSKCKWDK